MPSECRNGGVHVVRRNPIDGSPLGEKLILALGANRGAGLAEKSARISASARFPTPPSRTPKGFASDLQKISGRIRSVVAIGHREKHLPLLGTAARIAWSAIFGTNIERECPASPLAERCVLTRAHFEIGRTLLDSMSPELPSGSDLRSGWSAPRPESESEPELPSALTPKNTTTESVDEWTVNAIMRRYTKKCAEKGGSEFPRS